MPQPTLSEAHAFALAISKLRSGFASACMELTTIRHLRWHAACETPETLETLETPIELKRKLKRKQLVDPKFQRTRGQK